MPTRDVPCKKKYVETLEISNWLKKRQRFRVQIEMAKSTDGSRGTGSAARPGTQLDEAGTKPTTNKWESATNVSGLDYIDVPAAEKRDYALNFFAHKEGLVQAKVRQNFRRNNLHLVYFY